jgi:hypothetical protein
VFLNASVGPIDYKRKDGRRFLVSGNGLTFSNRDLFSSSKTGLGTRS